MTDGCGSYYFGLAVGILIGIAIAVGYYQSGRGDDGE